MPKQKRPRNMQRRVVSKPKSDPAGMRKAFNEAHPNRRKLNQYSCDLCGATITTVQNGADVDGTTPMFLSCKITDGCEGNMRSRMYLNIDPFAIPQFEWYTPAKMPKDKATREYLSMGGLLIRQIERPSESAGSNEQ